MEEMKQHLALISGLPRVSRTRGPSQF